MPPKQQKSMRLIKLLPLLLCFSSFAQVNIIIEDKTETGFKLGVNGFEQNTEPVKSLMIKGLDTVPNQLLIELSSNVWFTKIIHLRSKGNYQYIITTNSRYELQLRYRGTTSTPPAGITSLEVQRLVAMKQKQPVITASVTSDDTIVVKKVDTIKVAAVVPTKEIVEVKKIQPEPAPPIVVAKPTPIKDTTSTTIQKDTIINELNPFDSLMADLEETEFEFEKLQKSEAFAKDHTFTLEELKRVFNVLTYDASRLQLLRSIKANKADITVFKSLATELDYEISKQQFEEIISL